MFTSSLTISYNEFYLMGLHLSYISTALYYIVILHKTLIDKMLYLSFTI